MFLQNLSSNNLNTNSSIGNVDSNNQSDASNGLANSRNQQANSNIQPTNSNIQQPQNLNTNNVIQPFTDWSYIFLLISIILIFGALGGWVNHLLNRGEETINSRKDDSSNLLTINNLKGNGWSQPIIIGIAAAFLVPLFLQTISSQLLKEGYSNYLSLLVFAGFCLVAAISSKAFINTLSDKILQTAKEAKIVAREAKNESEKAKDTSETAQKTAAEAKENSADAQGSADSARNVALAVNPIEPTTSHDAMTKELASIENDPDAEKESLINEYNKIRETMEAGWTRTAEMSRILRRMINLMPKFPDLPVTEYLNEKDDLGKRLFGYAYFFYQPKREFLPELVESVSRIETKPFAQYWGILAIGKVLAEKSETILDPAITTSLKDFQLKLATGTDRWKELKNILAGQLGKNN